MAVLRPTQILPLPFLIPRLYSRLSTQGFHSSAASSSTTETSPRAPNPPLDIDPALQALLNDTDISILRSKTRHRAPETNKSSPLYRQPHRELEVLDVDGEGAGMTKAELVVEDEAKDLFPRSERKSPAASFGSRGIGALVLPFELQRSILRLISESDKPLIHADATRLFQEQNDSEDAWSTRYTSPSYTTPRSTSKISHIKARLNRQRDGTAFASVVMPAQYAVVTAVLEGVKTRLGGEWARSVDRVVEWGSGTGAGMWAALHAFRQPSGLPGDDTGDTSLGGSNIVAYAGIDKRDGLTTIARRLLRDIPLQHTSISLQKNLHASDRVPRTDGLSTVALSAFNLSTLGNAGLRRQMVREMWDSGADVIVIIDDASAEGFRHVADAREYLLKLGRREVDAVAREKISLASSAPETEPVETSAQDLDDGRGKRGSHVIAPCPHDRACPLAFHQLTSSASKSPAVQSSASSVRCTFSQRFQRPAFVRRTKHAGKGEEDVGYAYVVVRRGERPGAVQEFAGEEQLKRWGRVGAVGRWEGEAVQAKAREEEEERARKARWEDGPSSVETRAVDERKETPVEDKLRGEVLEEALRMEAYVWPRINFPPLKRSGHVLIDACMPEGNVMRLTFPRSQGKQIYYDARKSDWGDLFPHVPKHRPVPRYTGPKPKQAAPVAVPKDEVEDVESAKAEREFERALGLDGGEAKTGKEKGRGRGRGGEGALKVGVKSEGRAGWASVMDGLKEEDRKRRSKRRQERGAKEADVV